MSEPIIIELEFTGDCWYNPTRFQEQLNQIPLGQPVTLDLRSEGPSLQALGVCDVIDSWLCNRQQPPSDVRIIRWGNSAEFVPYRLIACSNPSHFFAMSRNYWSESAPDLEQQLSYHKFFGLFIGRMTYARATIIYQCLVGKQNIFVSKMSSPSPYPWQLVPQDEINLECMSDWLPTNQQYRMFGWYNQNTIPSVDQKTVRDQFASVHAYADTNRSLLNYYDRFAVEIVCETYTLGNTFFPTEKTIRPIMACKPVVVYGPQYFLARLRAMGFKTYSSLWDESYDLYEGPKRWRLIQKTMNSLQEKSKQDQQQLLAQAHEIAQHNRQKLQSMIPPSEFRNKELEIGSEIGQLRPLLT